MREEAPEDRGEPTTWTQGGPEPLFSGKGGDVVGAFVLVSARRQVSPRDPGRETNRMVASVDVWWRIRQAGVDDATVVVVDATSSAAAAAAADGGVGSAGALVIAVLVPIEACLNGDDDVGNHSELIGATINTASLMILI